MRMDAVLEGKGLYIHDASSRDFHRTLATMLVRDKHSGPEPSVSPVLAGETADASPRAT